MIYNTIAKHKGICQQNIYQVIVVSRAGSPTTRTTESSSASKFSFVNALLAVLILVMIQVLCA